MKKKKQRRKFNFIESTRAQHRMCSKTLPHITLFQELLTYRQCIPCNLQCAAWSYTETSYLTFLSFTLSPKCIYKKNCTRSSIWNLIKKKEKEGKAIYGFCLVSLGKVVYILYYITTEVTYTLILSSLSFISFFLFSSIPLRVRWLCIAICACIDRFTVGIPTVAK